MTVTTVMSEWAIDIDGDALNSPGSIDMSSSKTNILSLLQFPTYARCHQTHPGPKHQQAANLYTPFPYPLLLPLPLLPRQRIQLIG